MAEGNAIVCVTNDLTTDQRVHKTCLTLQSCGYDVTEYGRILPGSLPLERPYHTVRINHFFQRSALFYAEYNIRLFFYLLFHPANLIFANDLDTLPAAFLASKLKRCRLIYDTHEYYTETPELTGRPAIQRIWEKIEASIFPHLQDIITVNQSIADLYHQKYKKCLHVVRNIPPDILIDRNPGRAALGLPLDKKILILQGTGINIDRGSEEACLAMQYIDNCVLLIIGSGDVFPLLKNIVADNQLEQKVIFKPKMNAVELRKHTMQANLGISIDKDTNINYRYSLPNKLFDYIHADIPVLSSGLPELKHIIDQYNIGYFIDSHDPVAIADRVNEIFNNPSDYAIKKANLSKAREEYNWNQEQKKLINVIKSIKLIY
jgi:glycosyltransferase involved in cell wall biosynthesis